MRRTVLQPDHLDVYRLRPHVAAMVAWAIVNCGGSIRNWRDWPQPCSGRPPFNVFTIGEPRP